MDRGVVFTVDDPFGVLGFPRSFQLDPQAVVRAQGRALAQSHPDRHPEGVARELAVLRSAQVNAAATVLADPLLRAEALVSMGDPAGRAEPLSIDQLSQLLDWRESIEESVQASPAQAAECATWLKAQTNATMELLGSEFARTPIDWVSIRRLVAYLRALVRLSSDHARLVERRRGASR